jgi:hypothetical protein
MMPVEGSANIAVGAVLAYRFAQWARSSQPRKRREQDEAPFAA